MFQIIACGPFKSKNTTVGSKVSAPYCIIFYNEYTVDLFFKCYLRKYPHIYGFITISGLIKNFRYGKYYCFYQEGQLLSDLPKEILNEILNRKIIEASANGDGTIFLNFDIKI